MKTALLVLGVIILLAGIAASMYVQTATESHLWGAYETTSESKPYESASLPLIIGGFVLVIVGAVIK